MVEDIATGRDTAADESRARARDGRANPGRRKVSPPCPSRPPWPRRRRRWRPVVAAAVEAAARASQRSPSRPGHRPGRLPERALASTPTAQTYVYTQAKTDEEAARFLLQAQFSASKRTSPPSAAKGYLPWLGEQVDRPAEQRRARLDRRARPTTRSTPTT